MKKFKPREVNIVNKKKVIMIVGETPGKPKKNSTNEYAWMEMRSGNFLRELVKDQKNLILTNSYNYYCETKHERPRAQVIGKLELMNLIMQYKPIKIIALGNFAYETLISLPTKLNIIKLYHPSYILRFSRGIDAYKIKLLKELS